MKLIDFLFIEPKSKKQLLMELKNNGLSYKLKKNQIIIDNILIDDFKNVKIIYSLYYSKVTAIQVSFDKYNNTIEHIKGKLIELFGTPKRDNSKHNLENVFVYWKNDNRYISLFSKINENEITCIYKFHHDDLSHENNIYTFIISMIGGLVWGILFFILFGISTGYSPLLFVLSMIGGILWGFIFSVLMIKTTNYSGKIKKYDFTKKDMLLFSKYENQNKIEIDGIQCIATKIHKRKSCFFKAKLYVYDSFFIICYNIKNRIVVEKKFIKMVKRYFYSSTFKNIIIYFNDSPQLTLSLIDKQESIIKKLDESLGYNSKKFSDINNIVFNSIVNYDPEGMIAGGEKKDVFIDDAKCIAMDIFNRKKITVDEINYIIETHFEVIDDEVISDDWMSLAIDIFHDLYDSHLIDVK